MEIVVSEAEEIFGKLNHPQNMDWPQVLGVSYLDINLKQLFVASGLSRDLNEKNVYVLVSLVSGQCFSTCNL